MDIDRFIGEHQPAWDRLDELTRRGGRAVSRLSPDELDELVGLYQRVSTHLSYARTYFRDPVLQAALTRLTARAGAVVYGTRPRTVRAALRFVSTTFPAALWYARWFVAVSSAVFLLPAAAMGAWLANSPRALDAAAPPALREAYVSEDFESYYSSDPAAQFAAAVTTNNIQVAIMAFAGGILLCVPTLLLLVVNGANLGGAAGLFAAVGENAKFYGLIIPHGLLELSGVMIAGAAGLRLGWTLIDPGDRPRGAALIEEGRRAIVIVVGLVGVFVTAGVIEGFVTGHLPTPARVRIGVVVELAFLAYVVVAGRSAAARGSTGALGEEGGEGWLPRAKERTAVTAARST